ncbi:MAG TPA: TldD/PmbA family protein [Verrucomicrobiae bacterium]|nr:TldD/PmbA family protein [Verrucomicrobiae bacterium]
MRGGDLLDLADRISRMAGRAGADAAEALLEWSHEIEIKVVGGRLERTTEAVDLGCGLRVQKRGCPGFASTTDLSADGLRALVDAALAIAARVDADESASLPDPAPGVPPSLELLDPRLEDLPWDDALSLARRVEEGALAAGPAVKPGEGSAFARARGAVAVASTRGVRAAYEGSHCLLRSAPVAQSGSERQRQTWHEGRRFLADLPAPEEVGAAAARRALGMIGARTIAPGRYPVIFDAPQATRFWSGLAPALLGDSARRRISFLADDLGRAIASPSVTLVDDACVDRAYGSRPFDAEGLPARRVLLIDGGVLAGFLYDTRTARRASAVSTASAQRGYGSPPWPGAHALHLVPGEASHDDLLREAGRGLYVTGLLGFGVNLSTGDYSRGANGWWFEEGRIAHPVHEVTISGNLRDLLKRISRVGADLVRRSAHASPEFLIDAMTISGGREGSA